ncbi:MAG TPA: TerB family tellurite resistance protein [Thermoanaerobaculia bacterium]|nr:TerB family tellurite resistance protein [Thermoanaerobaculia bacterium]
MIIFGTRGIRMKGGTGTFYCPQCAGARQYTLRKMRRFFTLYFIPLIPLDVIGEYIECNYCHGTFRPEVLQSEARPAAEPARASTQVDTSIRRALLSVLIADGNPSPAARQAAHDAMRTVAAGDASELDASIESALRRPMNATGDIEAIIDALDYNRREALIRACVTIAQADGTMSAAEEKQIRALAKAAQITDAHLAGIIATAPRMTVAQISS